MSLEIGEFKTQLLYLRKLKLLSMGLRVVEHIFILGNSKIIGNSR